MENWKDIHSGFTEELVKEWESKGFTYEKTKEWIKLGYEPNDVSYCVWLRNTKNDGEEYEKHLSEVAKGFKLSEEIIKKIKKLDYDSKYYEALGEFQCRDDEYYDHDDRFTDSSYYRHFLREWNSSLERLIPNKELREGYNKYGLCSDCYQPILDSFGCRPCDSRKRIQELESELQMEREEAEKALQKAQEWRERQLKEITEQKDQEIEDLKKQVNQLQTQLNNLQIREQTAQVIQTLPPK